MKQIHIIARFKIHDGKLSEFKTVVDLCIKSTKTEAGARMYDWFIDEENMLCTVLETYQDSNATLAHAANVQELLSKLMEISDFSGEVFGNASQELSQALSQVNLVAVPFYKGL